MDIRTTVPLKDNKYYLRKASGGYNPCIKGSPLYCDGSVLANCVGYCYGRAMEVMGETDSTKMLIYSVGAGNWFAKSKYPKGATPQEGAIACWRKNKSRAGHVAFIEKVESDKITFTESGYNNYNFHLVIAYKDYCTIDGKKATTYKFDGTSIIRTGYTMQGYVYIPVPEEKEDPVPEELKVGDRVQIISIGNSQASGKGNTARGIGWYRKVLKIYKGYAFPYRVGSGSATTGFYKKEALKKY